MLSIQVSKNMPPLRRAFSNLSSSAAAEERLQKISPSKRARHDRSSSITLEPTSLEQLECNLRDEEWLYNAAKDHKRVFLWNPYDGGRGPLAKIGFRKIGESFVHDELSSPTVLPNNTATTIRTTNELQTYLVKHGIPNLHCLTWSERLQLEVWVRVRNTVNETLHHDACHNAQRPWEKLSDTTIHRLLQQYYQGKRVRIVCENGLELYSLGVDMANHNAERVSLQELRVYLRANPAALLPVKPASTIATPSPPPPPSNNQVLLALQMWIATVPIPLPRNWTHKEVDFRLTREDWLFEQLQESMLTTGPHLWEDYLKPIGFHEDFSHKQLGRNLEDRKELRRVLVEKGIPARDRLSPVKRLELEVWFRQEGVVDFTLLATARNAKTKKDGGYKTIAYRKLTDTEARQLVCQYYCGTPILLQCCDAVYPLPRQSAAAEAVTLSELRGHLCREPDRIKFSLIQDKTSKLALQLWIGSCPLPFLPVFEEQTQQDSKTGSSDPASNREQDYLHTSDYVQALLSLVDAANPSPSTEMIVSDRNVLTKKEVLCASKQETPAVGGDVLSTLRSENLLSSVLPKDLIPPKLPLTRAIGLGRSEMTPFIPLQNHDSRTVAAKGALSTLQVPQSLPLVPQTLPATVPPSLLLQQANVGYGVSQLPALGKPTGGAWNINSLLGLFAAAVNHNQSPDAVTGASTPVSQQGQAPDLISSAQRLPAAGGSQAQTTRQRPIGPAPRDSNIDTLFESLVETLDEIKLAKLQVAILTDQRNEIRERLAALFGEEDLDDEEEEEEEDSKPFAIDDNYYPKYLQQIENKITRLEEDIARLEELEEDLCELEDDL